MKNVFIVKDELNGFVSVHYWCIKNNIELNTMIQRIIRWQFAPSKTGIVILDEKNAVHRDLFRKYRDRRKSNQH